MKFSTADLARVLGLTERRIQQLEKLGVFRRVAHGEWDLPASVQSYVRHRLQSEIRQSRSAEANKRLRLARAREVEVRTAERERRLIDTNEALNAIDEVLGTFLAELAGLPARVTRDLYLRTKLENEI